MLAHASRGCFLRNGRTLALTHGSISIVAGGRLDVGDGAHRTFVMKNVEVACAVNLHNAVTVSQQRLGKRVAQLSSARMNEVCAALRFSLGCENTLG